MPLAANQPNGINVEHQSRFAPRLMRFGIEHQSISEGQLDLVQPIRMLVEQKSQIGRRLMRGRD